MDSQDLLSLLTNLQLQPQSTSTSPPFSTFTLFPTLPTELRLRIISHTLPAPTTLRVHATITVADPSFGLYITFAPAVTTNSNAVSSFTLKPTTEPPLKSTRTLNLLLVNNEFYSFYTETFPHSLPTGIRGKGKIRFATGETVYIKNFDAFMKDPDFIFAMQNSYRLQHFWNEIQHLSLPTTALLSPPRIPVRKIDPEIVLFKFGKLREVRACMWGGFEEGSYNEARRGIRRALEMQLGDLRLRLGALKGVEGVEDCKGWVAEGVPEIVLV